MLLENNNGNAYALWKKLTFSEKFPYDNFIKLLYFWSSQGTHDDMKYGLQNEKGVGKIAPRGQN